MFPCGLHAECGCNIDDIYDNTHECVTRMKGVNIDLYVVVSRSSVVIGRLDTIAEFNS